MAVQRTRRRRLQQANSGDRAQEEGDLELVVMADWVMQDAIVITGTIDELDRAALEKGALVLGFFGTVLIFLFGSLMTANMLHRSSALKDKERVRAAAKAQEVMHLREQHVLDAAEVGGRGHLQRGVSSLHGMNGPQVLPVGHVLLSKEGHEVSKMMQYISGFFPGCFSGGSAGSRIGREMKNHQVVSLIFSAPSLTGRLVASFEIFTTVCFNAFIIALLLDLQYPMDDGACNTHTDRDSCLFEVSMFDTSESRCEWLQEQPDSVVYKCWWKKPELSLFTLMYLVIIVVAITTPAFTALEAVFGKVITAPAPPNMVPHMHFHLSPLSRTSVKYLPHCLHYTFLRTGTSSDGPRQLYRWGEGRGRRRAFRFDNKDRCSC
jgi:hypothetical protein